MMYNAMTYSDVKSFAITLHQDCTEKLLGKEISRLNRTHYDDDQIAQ